MKLSPFLKKTKRPIFLYIVSVDRLFTKDLGKHNSLSVFDKVVEASSGDELLIELSYNPIPKGASAITIVDFVLIDRDHPHSPNGLEVLAQLQEQYKDMELILLLKPVDKSTKNTARKMGIDNVLIKNDNFYVRFEITLKDILNKLTLHRSERELRLLLLIFTIFTTISIATILLISLLEQ